MEYTAVEPQVFQWVKGDYEGVIVKVVDRFVEDNIEFLVFEDGSQCNSALIGEYIMPVPPGTAPPLPTVSAFRPPKRQPQAEKSQPTPVQADPLPLVQTSPISEHPIHNLLNISKKKPVKLEVTVCVDMPSEDLLKVMIEEFPDGADIIGTYLVSTINQEDMMAQIKSLLKSKIKQIVASKKKISKNESFS